MPHVYSSARTALMAGKDRDSKFFWANKTCERNYFIGIDQFWEFPDGSELMYDGVSLRFKVLEKKRKNSYKLIISREES